MLSSRYLHLHEALGLGPMWLQRGAKVLPAAIEAAPAAVPAPPAAAMPSTAPSAATAPQAAAPSAAAQQARLAAIAAVGGQDTARSDGLSQAPQPSEKTTMPAHEATQHASDNSDWLHTLADRIPRARVLVAAICPAPEDSAGGRLFSGSVGVLLDNMLAATGLSPADAHKTSWVQDAPIFSPNPAAADILAALPRMQAELALSQAEAVLLLGQIFTKPEQADAIAALCGNLPCFVIPHPARLLRQPQLKAQAWQELKKLRRLLAK